MNDIDEKKIASSAADNNSLDVRFEDEFNCTIASRLGVYLVDELQLSVGELKQLLKEMKDSYVLHRINGDSALEWFSRIKKNVLEFASLRDLQVEYNELIDQKRDTLRELGLDTNEFELQKIGRTDFLSLLIERLRADCEDISLMRNYYNYRDKLAKLASMVNSFKKNYTDLQLRFHGSQDDLAHFQGENAELKAEIAEFKNRNSLIKTRFNRILNRFADASRINKISALRREKKLIATINSLNDQLDYWKNKYPQWLVSYVAGEFKKKIRAIVSEFEQQSSKLSAFYIAKFQGLKKKDTTIFKKYNEVVGDYENQRRNLLNLLDNRTKKFDQLKEKLNAKVVNERARYAFRLENERAKIRALRERYEEKITKLNEVHLSKLKNQWELINSQTKPENRSVSVDAVLAHSASVAVKRGQGASAKSKVTTPIASAKTKENEAPGELVQTGTTSFKKMVDAPRITITKKIKTKPTEKTLPTTSETELEENKIINPKRELIDIIGETKYTLQRKNQPVKKSARKLSLTDEGNADIIAKKKMQKR